MLLSRYRGRDPLCDPFCGSGTILIEGALLARNIAPGLGRAFTAESWGSVPGQLWQQERMRSIWEAAVLVPELMHRMQQEKKWWKPSGMPIFTAAVCT